MQLMQFDTVVNDERERACEMDWIITGSSDEKKLDLRVEHELSPEGWPEIVSEN